MSVNRYYAGDDITGKALARRIGIGKMGIITETGIKVVALGLNRDVLLDLDVPQPEFNFFVKNALDIRNLENISERFRMDLVMVTGDRILFTRMLQVPPELNCKFDNDEVGAEYQILMLFNTSRCSFIEDEDDVLLGNIETVCEIAVPVLITTRQIQFEKSESILVQVILIVLLFIIFGSLLLCYLRCNRGLE